MLSLKSIQIVDSKLFPGVKYKIRALNVIQRAKRDAEIAAHRLEYSRVSAEQSTLFRKLIGTESTAFVRELRAAVAKLDLPADHPVTLGLAQFCERADMEAKLDKLSPADAALLTAAQQAQAAVYQEHIIPASIRGALIAVEGLTFNGIDGRMPTVDEVLAEAPDEMLDEIKTACDDATCLVEDAAKN
jgi:hypothetical protein